MRKRIVSILLIVCLAVSLLPGAVLAAGTGKSVNLGASPLEPWHDTEGFHYVYFGIGSFARKDAPSTNEPIKWRVLDTKTNTGSEHGVFMVSDELLGTNIKGNGDLYFDPTRDTATWNGSDAQDWCKAFCGEVVNAYQPDIGGESDLVPDIVPAFTGSELGAVMTAWNIDTTSTDRVFFLSLDEINNANYGLWTDSYRIAEFEGVADNWLLRTDTGSKMEPLNMNYVYGINADGTVSNHNPLDNYAARPAFNLRKSDVLFTMAADNSGHINFGDAIPAYSGKEWKLTLRDGFDFTHHTSLNTTTVPPGGTLTLSHDNLSSFTDDSSGVSRPVGYTNVTAVLTDSSGALVYYGSINNSTHDRESRITFPEELAEGIYTLSVYAEKRNDANCTDYVSGTPFTATITVGSMVTAPTFDMSTLEFQTTPLDFGSVEVGYTEPPARDYLPVYYNSTSTNKQPVCISLSEGTAFDVDTSVKTMGNVNYTTFEVRPKAGLAAGVYTETFTLTATSPDGNTVYGTLESPTVTFKVTPPEHTHPLCGTACTHTESHDGLVWEPWGDDPSEQNTLPSTSGSYYLTQDITVDGDWDVSVNCNLCLNGHDIKLTGIIPSIFVDASAHLVLADCCTDQIRYGYWNGSQYNFSDSNNIYGVTDYDLIPGGMITDGGWGLIDALGTFTMYGGTLAGNLIDHDSISYPGAVLVTGVFNLYGGQIIGNESTLNSGGIHQNGTLNLGGSIVIDNNRNSDGADANLYLNTDCLVTILEPLADGARIGITMQTPGVFTSGNNDAENTAFFSDDPNYKIVTRGQELALVPLDFAGEVTITLAGENVLWYTDADCTTEAVSPFSAMAAEELTLFLKAADGYYYPSAPTVDGASVSRLGGGDGSIFVVKYTPAADATLTPSAPSPVEYVTITLAGEHITWDQESPLQVIKGSTANVTFTPDEGYFYESTPNVTFTPMVNASNTTAASNGGYTVTLITTQDTTVTPEAPLSLADAHAHPVCGPTCSHDPTHGEENFLPTASLPSASGSYYLTRDITIYDYWEVYYADITLCLNGHKIVYDPSQASVDDPEPVIYIHTDSSLTLCDCNGSNSSYQFSENEDGLWALDEAGTETVTGGIITGGLASGIYCYGDLTLHGGSIVGNAESYNGYGGGVYLSSDSSFLMTGGQIAGNLARAVYSDEDIYGEGGGVFNFGTFTMTGGQIRGNTACKESGYGGGVTNVGTFTMSGGSITENYAEYSGGLCVYTSNPDFPALFTMTGGTITDNTAYRTGGMGVYYDGTVIALSGDACISGNFVVNANGQRTSPSDVYLDTDRKITVGEFTENAAIGLYMEVSGIFTIGNQVTENTVFSSNNPVYIVLLDEATGEWKLGEAPVICILSFETNGGSTIEDVSAEAGTVIDLTQYTTTRSGFTFNGWYAEPTLVTRITSVTPEADTTIYAGWTQNSTEPELPPVTPPVAPGAPTQPTPPSVEDTPFRDVTKNDWFYDEVLYVYKNGLMMGTAADLFSPNMNITRGMLVTILYRVEGKPTVTGANPFPDVEKTWYYHDPIVWGAANGIVLGYGNGNFGPNDPITREQLAAILWRYAKYKGMDVSVGENTNILSYADFTEISEYAIPAMQWACGAGLMKGTGTGMLSPRKYATRAEVATMLQRFLTLS